MKVISWNINSVRARIMMLRRLINTEAPDVLLLQETKCVESDFPYHELEDYNCYVWGQKSYNGVAILTKKSLKPCSIEKVPLGSREDQARCIKATFGDLSVISVYVPCGSTDGPMYEYKKGYLDDLAHYLKSIKGKIVIGGDFNVAKTDEDVQSIRDFKDGVLCLEVFRQGLREVLANQLEDVFDSRQYTWWDYRSPNKGLRIDYIFIRGVTGKQTVMTSYRRMIISDFQIMKNEKTKLVEIKPSDHAPVVLTVVNP